MDENDRPEENNSVQRFNAPLGGQAGDPRIFSAAGGPIPNAAAVQGRPLTFRDVLWQLTPRVWVTPALVVINVLVFLGMAWSGAGMGEPNTTLLVKWGANFAPLTTTGQWWRLLTCTFVHIGPVHIGMNMIVLVIVGPLVERLLGNVGFLVTYLIAGLAGSVLSLVWSPDVVSAGASGAIFGLYGALMGFVILRRDTIPQPVVGSLLRSAVFFVGYNIYYGFQKGSHIDNGGHIGGLLGGVVCGLLLSQPLGPKAARLRPIRNALTALVGGAAITLATYLAAHTVNATYRAAHTVDVELDHFYEVQTHVIETYKDAWKKNQAGQLSDEDLAATLQSRVIAPWREEDVQLKKVLADMRESGKQRHEVTLLVEFMDQRLAQWEAQAQLIGTSDPQAAEQITQQMETHGQKADQILKELNGSKNSK